MCRRDKCLFDATRIGPTDKIERTSRFSIRSGSPRAAKRLLGNDGSGRFIIDIEITGGVAKFVKSCLNGITIRREN